MPLKVTTKGSIELWRGNTKVSTHTVETEAIERATADSEKTKAVLYTVKFPNKEIDLSTLSRVVFDPDVLAPTAPIITATAVSQTSISVALAAASTDIQSGIASYRLEYKRNVDPTWSLAAAGLLAGQFPFTISGLTSATLYDTRCRATDGANNVGPFSGISQANTPSSVLPSVWSTVPTIIFTQGVAANIDISQYDSKGTTDTITHIAGTFPTGVTYNVAQKRYEYDGVGAVAGQNGHILIADDSAGDWAIRSQAAGVVLSATLSTASEITNWRFAGPEAVPPSVDTSTKCIGQAASIRLTSSNTDTTQSGTLRIPFGRTFVTGETFYVAFRQYMPPEWAYMLHPIGSPSQEQGMKQAIISETAASHTNLEVVWEGALAESLVFGYHDNEFGSVDTWTEAFQSDYRFQPVIDNSVAATTSPDSVYSFVNGGTDPDTGSAFSANQISWSRYGGRYAARSDSAFAYGLGHPLAGGMRYPVNQFATYLYRIVVGNSGVANTQITAWCAPAGQPYVKLYHSTTEAFAAGVGPGYSAIWILAYHTDRIAGGISVSSRSNSALSACTAIRVLGTGTGVGSATLSWNATTKRFTFTAPGGSAGTARGVASWKRFVNVISGGSTGAYNGQFVGIEVTDWAALNAIATNQTDTITIASGRGTQTTNLNELLVATTPINATAYNDSGVKVGPTGGYAPT